MAGRRVHFVMPDELVERIDAACPEGQSRGEFVRRAVEQALGGAVKDSSGVHRAEPPAPAEPPVEQASGVGSRDSPAPAEEPVARAIVRAAQTPRAHSATCKCPVCSS